MLELMLGRAKTVKGQEVVPLIRRGTFLVLLLIWSVAAIAAALAVWLLFTRAASQTDATAQGLEQYARRNIEISSFVADDFVRFLDRSGAGVITSDPAAAVVELVRVVKRLPMGSAAAFVLPDGLVNLSTSPLPAKPVYLNDRRWFQAHVRDGVTNYVGPAIHSRVIDRIVYTYSQSYHGRDGRLLGMLNLGIPSKSIIDIAPDDIEVSMALIQHEGALVAAQPIDDTMLGIPTELPGPPPEVEATMIGRAFGRYSVATIRNLPEHSLYAVAAVPLVTVLAPALWGIPLMFGALLPFSFALLQMSRIAQQKSREVEQALSDNKVLFQEVHHRVKNNLQVISSLIRLQTDRLPPELRPLMEQTAARVRAIAMVHEQIYTTATPSEVSLDMFLQKLLGQLETSLLAGSNAGLTMKLEPVQIGLDRAVPVALLATEALTNAIKHGVGDAGGTITVELAREAGMTVLRVINSGREPVADSAAGLGSRIMTALARQIDGKWTLEPHPGGACFTLTWPEGDRVETVVQPAA